MLIRTNNFELEISGGWLYLKAFNTAYFIKPSDYPSWKYYKDSPTDRELHLGKVEVIISKLIH